MEAIIERACGIDVHKKNIVACLLIGKPSEKPKKTVKTFSTMTEDLLACKDWLESEGCTHVALESTGVYWKPIFNILEERMEVILANARDIKNVPGRKTDVKDCEWIADLLRHGLIKGSFIPPKIYANYVILPVIAVSLSRTDPQNSTVFRNSWRMPT